MPAPGRLQRRSRLLLSRPVIADRLTAHHLDSDDAVDATHAFRSTLHGIVSDEIAGDFHWSAGVNRSFDRSSADSSSH